ncbi:MAG TPA: hypothetical protein VHN10_10060 [Candidatus Acidoferrales bacterium]|jgi:uncharacterized membrane protein YdcZ (DUF606 family)|nr:hypothetical protein [Candidatus Acidoferrales bacterium]
MKIHPFVVLGVLLIGCGIAALIHPNLSMPSKKQEVVIDSQKAIVETTRIVELPRVFSVLLLLAGGSLIFLSTRKT